MHEKNASIQIDVMPWVANSTLVPTYPSLASLLPLKSQRTRRQNKGVQVHASGDDTETGSTHYSKLDWQNYHTYTLYAFWILDTANFCGFFEWPFHFADAIQGPGDRCMLQLLLAVTRRTRVLAWLAAKGLPDWDIKSEELVDGSTWTLIRDSTDHATEHVTMPS